MAGDRINIPTLERAASNDINDLQSMQSRVLADWLLELSAARTVEFFGGATDQFPQSVTMGLACRGAGATITVQPGVLGQASLTWPAVPGALESLFRIGISRADVPVPVPAVPSIFMILEARVVDVVTSTQVRDVFDVPSQTFLPAAVTKRVERRIEFQIIQGDANSLPAFTGDPWVPILGFFTDALGLVPTLPSAVSWDMRNDLKDVLGDDQVVTGALASLPDAQVSCNAAHTLAPGSDLDNRIGGNFNGRIGWMRAWLRAEGGVIVQDDTSIVSAAADRFEHLYLAPLIANGVTVMPVGSGTAFFEAVKGILWATETQPHASGRDNSAAITPIPGSVYANFDPVPAHRAVHVMSLYRTDALHYRWTTQSSGGEVKTQTPVGSALLSVALRASAPLAAPAVLTVDLRGKIPANARMVTLAITINTDGTAGAGSFVAAYLKQRLGTASEPLLNTYYATVPGGLGVPMGAVLVADVPCHFNDGTLEGQRFELMLSVSGTPVVAVNVGCAGWSI